MTVKQSKVRGKRTTLHTLEATINGQTFAVRHSIPHGMYHMLTRKDAQDLIERSLWANLMHQIEHYLKGSACANPKS